MQAMEFKRHTVKRIGIVVVAIEALAIGIIGANALHDAAQDNAGSAATVRSSPQIDQTQAMRFLEWNTQLPAIVVEPVQTAAELRFLESNTLLPGHAAPRLPSYAELRFLEMNIDLPGADAQHYPSPRDKQPGSVDGAK